MSDPCLINTGCNIISKEFPFSWFKLFFFKFITDVGQRTTPAELPIYGDPYTEIALELIFAKENPIFLLNGKMLQLLKPLDRDQDNISHIVFQVNCLSYITAILVT